MSEGWPPGPAQPAAPCAELHLWRAELDAPGWPGPDGLPTEERERAAAMLRPRVEARWVAARWALRHVLARYLDGEPPEIALALDPNGKPRLAEGADRLRFNLSHSGGLALIALNADRAVGVDVEKVHLDRDPVALAEAALAAEDADAVREAAASERALVFHQRWARHEARLKCLGVGIFRQSTVGTPTVAVEDVEVAPGYAAAVAIEGAQVPPLRCWTFDPGALQKDGNRVS